MIVSGIVLILGYVKAAVLFLVKKLWVPLVFFGSIVPGILGTFSYLQEQGVHWLFSTPATLGFEFGGQIPMLLNSLQYLNDPSVPVLPLIVGSVHGVLRLYWAWYLWSRVINFIDSEVSPMLVYGLFIGFFGLCISFALFAAIHVLPAENLHISGLMYFLENPSQALGPVGQFMGERAAEDSALNHTVNNTNMTS